MPEIKDTFDPIRVDLQKCPHGVEASAGTGKTYSIAILALRMILEENLQTKDLLMVTFTNAAVAELEIRVRSFIRKALKVARDPNAKIDDDNLRELILLQVKNQGASQVCDKLYDAALRLEDLSILTFHGFCTRVLRDFSFETRQLFDAEMMTKDDWNGLVTEHFNQFWRTRIATLPPDVLRRILDLGDHDRPVRKRVQQLVINSLDGKKPYVWSYPKGGILSEQHLKDILNPPPYVLNARNALAARIRLQLNEIKNLASEHGGKAKKELVPLLEADDIEGFIQAIETPLKKKEPSKYAVAVLPPFESEWKEFLEAPELENNQGRLLLAQIAEAAWQSMKSLISEHQAKLATQTFNDLIINVRNAIENPETRASIRSVLRNDYKAVFIDEFQDTDPDQYSIFNHLFGDDHYLFYIGDPKQSIYGFRKADINTYLKAMKNVAVLHRMNVNHRSSERMIQAMNQFFLPQPGFDTFLYGEDLPYLEVKSPEKNSKAVLYENGEPAVPIRVSFHSSKEKRQAAVANLIIELVSSSKFQLFRDGEIHSIKYSDIGVVVRTNETGKPIQKLLSAAGVPVVTVDETQILSTEEARELFLVLEAIQDGSRGAVNKAMLTRLLGFRISGLLIKKEEDLMNRFRIYKETWIEKGIYEAMQMIMADHQVSDRYNESSEAGAERSVANLIQLSDLLHRVSMEESLAPDDLLRWLKKGVDGMLMEGDEYIQRLERDEDAVKIVTIHKAKGLEYPIVICPDLDMSQEPKEKSPSVWQDEEGFLTAEPGVLEINSDKMKLFREQARRENRRLLYVAITRARQACFIVGGKAPEKTEDPSQVVSTNCLNDFLMVMPWDNLVAAWTLSEEKPGRVVATSSAKSPQYSDIGNVILPDLGWKKASFTSLTPEHSRQSLPRASSEEMEELDRFVFTQVRRGSQSGDMMHEILETIDFTYPAGWSEIVSRIVGRFLPRQSEDYLKSMEYWLEVITQIPFIPDHSFTLSQLNRSSRKSELEFNFSLKSFETAQLENISASAPVSIRAMQLEGLMNGFIDLLFFHEGRYYILDWKTNYLGASVDDYSHEKLAVAMAENNYHLQYLIYSVAVKRYLSLRIPEFDFDKHFGGVIYLFLRGMREGQDNGIFFTRPDRTVIERMDGLFRGEVAQPLSKD